MGHSSHSLVISVTMLVGYSWNVLSFSEHGVSMAESTSSLEFGIEPTLVQDWVWSKIGMTSA